MNAESKASPAGDDSRRNFLQKVATLAAASGLAADGSAAAPQTQPQTMPMVRFGKHMVSRLIMGVNTIGGGSHLSNMIDVEMRAWHTPERMVQIFKHCEALGINCMEAGNAAAKYNTEHGGKMLWTARGAARLENSKSTRPWRTPKEIAAAGPIGIHHLGHDEFGTDAWWRKGQLDKVREYCKMVRDTGVLVAVTSHRPEVFKEIESQDWDVDYYMTCLYKYGRTKAEWEKAFEYNPGMMPAEIYHSKEPTSEHYGGETAFVRGDPAEMYQVIKQTRKPCFVYKILASGRLCEKPEFVEAAFKECFANIKPTDAVVVGMYDKHIDQYAMNAEYVRKYGSNTATSVSAL
jgi:hypothetical protein